PCPLPHARLPRPEQPLVLGQPRRPNLPLLQMRRPRQRPGPVGCRQRSEYLRCRCGSVRTSRPAPADPARNREEEPVGFGSEFTTTWPQRVTHPKPANSTKAFFQFRLNQNTTTALERSLPAAADSKSAERPSPGSHKQTSHPCRPRIGLALALFCSGRPHPPSAWRSAQLAWSQDGGTRKRGDESRAGIGPCSR